MQKHNYLSKLIISSFIVTIIVISIYWPGLKSPLMLDDGPQIIPILHGVNGENWKEIYKGYIFSNSGQLSRPIPMMTFIANAVISGNEIWYWKLTNVFLHLLCGLSAFFLTRLVLSLDERTSQYKIGFLSVSVSIIWLTHPLQLSTVLYLTQRMTILGTLFTINSLSCYVFAFKKETNNESGATYLVLSILLFTLALFSKENAVLFPFYTLLTSLFILQTKSISYRALPNNIRRYNLLMIVVIATGIIIFIKHYNTLILDGYNSRSFSLQERTLTEARVIVIYLFQIITPFPSTMGFFHDDIIISKSITSPHSTLISILFIVFIIIFTFKNNKKHPLLSYGLLFFFTSHLVESSIFPLEIAFEHRNYIGIWGIFLSFTYILNRIKLNNIFVMSAICLILSGLTFARAIKWSSPNIMYPYMLSIHPNSTRLHSIFADTYASSGEYTKALEYIANDNRLGARLQRLSIKCRKNGTIDSESLLMSLHNKSSIKIGTYEMDGIIELANLGLDNQCSFSKDEFIELLLTIITSARMNNTDAQKSLIYLAHYYHYKGETNNAIKSLESSFNKDEKNPIPLFLMVEWLIEKNRINEANTIFNKANIIATNSLSDYSDFIKRITPMLVKNPD
jgi:tetratricopeptide (TPR) repeat protein